MRGVVEIEEDSRGRTGRITELPYQVNTRQLHHSLSRARSATARAGISNIETGSERVGSGSWSS